ncbi:FAD dependent oxidoreductase [Dipodascopsis uninucleata]
MTIIIVGAGIIGLSTAFCLANRPRTSLEPVDRIIVVDTSRKLFACASGRAAGFLNRSWFSPRASALAELSFVMHGEFAEMYGGKDLWGYRPARAWSVTGRYDKLSVEEYNSLKQERLAQRKMRSLQSKSPGGSSTNSSYTENIYERYDAGDDKQLPDYFFCDEEQTAQIAGEDECAVINPLELCEFLLSQCTSKGVEILYPCELESVTKTENGLLDKAVLRNRDTEEARTIDDISKIVIAAGPWTSYIFESLFPKAVYRPSVTPLTGFSVVMTSPLLKTGETHEPTFFNGDESMTGQIQDVCDALFVRPMGIGRWFPEIFSKSNGDLYMSGLNGNENHSWVGGMAPGSFYERDLTDDQNWESENISTTINNFTALNLVAKSVLGPEVVIKRKSSCMRPMTPNGDPIIGEVPSEVLDGYKGVYICAGHGPWGINLCLGSGQVMAEMLLDGKVRSADISGLQVHIQD